MWYNAQIPDASTDSLNKFYFQEEGVFQRGGKTQSVDPV